MLNGQAVNLDETAIRAWISAVEQEVREHSGAVEAAQQQLSQARKRLMLLHEMLASVTKTPLTDFVDGLLVGRSVRDRTIGDAEEILRAYGHPMRVQDIHLEFIRRGKPLPGRGTSTNIVAHLLTATSIQKLQRGVYGLAEWNTPIGYRGRSRQAAKEQRKRRKMATGKPGTGGQVKR
jgi:hypothetical protein